MLWQNGNAFDLYHLQKYSNVSNVLVKNTSQPHWTAPALFKVLTQQHSHMKPDAQDLISSVCMKMLPCRGQLGSTAVNLIALLFTLLLILLWSFSTSCRIRSYPTAKNIVTSGGRQLHLTIIVSYVQSWIIISSRV